MFIENCKAGAFANLFVRYEKMLFFRFICFEKYELNIDYMNIHNQKILSNINDNISQFENRMVVFC